MALDQPRRKKLTIALVAHSGGHVAELQAVEAAWKGHDFFYVTQRRPWTENLKPAYLTPGPSVRRFATLKVLAMLVMATFVVMWVWLKRRPDVIVTTGGEIALPAFWLGKLIRAKTIFIESYARTEGLSLAARAVRPVTDAFFVQHQEQADASGGRFQYAGNVL
ncbi:MAG: hypothetical protein ACYTE6_06960 [Planctomycetota bacterium]|jgi:UDP-N-acetylglucosamine:LPS N-acetylglucosamine transferase